MGTTNNGLHYPEAGDLVRDYPTVQRASQEAIDARISELDEGLQPVRAATDAREGGTLVKRRRDGGSNHQSLWVAEVPKNAGSVTHKGYVDAQDAGRFPFQLTPTSSNVDEIIEPGQYAINSTSNYTNPPLRGAASLEVLPFNTSHGHWIIQRWTAWYDGETFTRSSNDEGVTWKPWREHGGGWTPPPWTDGTPGTDVTAGTNRYVRIRDNLDGTATIALNVLSQSWTDMDAGTLRTLATFPRGAANLPADSYAPLAIRAFDLDYATVDEVLSVAISRPLNGSSPIEILLQQPPSRVFMNAPMVGILTVPTT